MKDKEKKKTEELKTDPEITMDQLKGSEPFVFEEDRGVVEELANQSKYIRGLFST